MKDSDYEVEIDYVGHDLSDVTLLEKCAVHLQLFSLPPSTPPTKKQHRCFGMYRGAAPRQGINTISNATWY